MKAMVVMKQRKRVNQYQVAGEHIKLTVIVIVVMKALKT
jgi:hypothetical protein